MSRAPRWSQEQLDAYLRRRNGGTGDAQDATPTPPPPPEHGPALSGPKKAVSGGRGPGAKKGVGGGVCESTIRFRAGAGEQMEASK